MSDNEIDKMVVIAVMAAMILYFLIDRWHHNKKD